MNNDEQDQNPPENTDTQPTDVNPDSNQGSENLEPATDDGGVDIAVTRRDTDEEVAPAMQEPESAETPEPEQEPEMPVEESGEDLSQQTTVEPEAEPAVVPVAPVVPPTEDQKPRKIAGIFTSKKQAIVAAVVVALLVVGGVAAYVVMSQSSDDTSGADSDSKTVAKMGLATTVVDGTASYRSLGATEWTPLTTETQLTEGAQVQTAANSRVVLAFDDGSALRLDASTTVVLASLAVDDIRVEQVEGAAYSRVVASDRSYAVVVDGVNYKALGTAFSTVALEKEQGVRVFESQVEVDGVDGAVAEGKQYLTKSSKAELTRKVTALDVDQLAKDEFVAWNLAQDEKDEAFKAKLGVLVQVKQRSQELKKEQLEEKARLEAEAKAKAEAEAKAAAEAAAKAAAEKDKTSIDKDKVTRGSMSLSLSGNTFSWSYSGKAVHGYKLVYSKTNSVPVFGKDSATYFGSIDQTSGSLPKASKIGSGKYYVRVCAYTAGTESEPCVDYSAVRTINI